MEVAADWLGATPILVGHSMGGYVAQKFLTRRPALGLALLCSVPPQGLLASQINLMFSRPNLFIEMNQMMDGKIPNAKVVRDALFAGEISDEVVNQFLSTTQRESQRAIWDMSMVSLFGHGIRELPPMLVIGAEKDVLIPPFLVQATARAFGVEATIYPGMGHAITHEKAWPDVSAKLIQWAETL
jgi:pimeloyl-ACP methyl ester carboxylesterase